MGTRKGSLRGEKRPSTFKSCKVRKKRGRVGFGLGGGARGGKKAAGSQVTKSAKSRRKLGLKYHYAGKKQRWDPRECRQTKRKSIHVKPRGRETRVGRRRREEEKILQEQRRNETKGEGKKSAS